jgi:hypothetical protein
LTLSLTAGSVTTSPPSTCKQLEKGVSIINPNPASAIRIASSAFVGALTSYLEVDNKPEQTNHDGPELEDSVTARAQAIASEHPNQT